MDLAQRKRPMATTLDYTKPVTTSNRNNVHVYHVYKDYMNGAWYNEIEDIWIPSQWTLSGYFLPNMNGRYRAADLDLMNV